MRAILVGFLVFGCFTLGGASIARTEPTSFQVIVNLENTIESIDRDFLADIYLKRATYWPNNVLIRPVDLYPDSTVRRRFSENILKRSAPSVRIYWQQRIFTGRGVPPPELDSNQAVIDYVRAHPGAIGYVSGDITPRQVRIITVK